MVLDHEKHRGLLINKSQTKYPFYHQLQQLVSLIFQKSDD